MLSIYWRGLPPLNIASIYWIFWDILNDIYGERGTWLRLWMGNQPLGLWWGSHAFELIYRAIWPRFQLILTATWSRQCLRQRCVFWCKMRARFVISCYVSVDLQLHSSLVIMSVCGSCCGLEYLFSNSRRPEAPGVCREGQGGHRCLRTLRPEEADLARFVEIVKFESNQHLPQLTKFTLRENFFFIIYLNKTFCLYWTYCALTELYWTYCASQNLYRVNVFRGRVAPERFG